MGPEEDVFGRNSKRSENQGVQGEKNHDSSERNLIQSLTSIQFSITITLELATQKQASL